MMEWLLKTISLPAWIVVSFMLYSIIMIVWNMCEFAKTLAKHGSPSDFSLRLWRLCLGKIFKPQIPQNQRINKENKQSGNNGDTLVVICPIKPEVTHKTNQCSQRQSTNQPATKNPTHAETLPQEKEGNQPNANSTFHNYRVWVNLGDLPFSVNRRLAVIYGKISSRFQISSGAIFGRYASWGSITRTKSFFQFQCLSTAFQSPGAVSK